ncbi:hypothetical protein DD606_26215, partial [Enterobacter cloacae complex sp. GF14B]
YQILSYPDFIPSRFYFIQILFHLDFISSRFYFIQSYLILSRFYFISFMGLDLKQICKLWG